MKILIVDRNDPKSIGELVTASRKLGPMADILAVGKGEIPGSYGRAYQVDETVGANLVSALEGLVRQEGYGLVLLSASVLGAEISGPLAARLRVSAITEVTALDADLTVERPIYGGKASARVKITRLPAILTLRRKYFEPAILEGTTPGSALPLGAAALVRVESESLEPSEGVALEDAEVIVTGGRGIGGAENFSMLREMASLLKGAVGASRGAVDEGWAPPSRQIGQTGKMVAPSVYFAVGVSGASQHLAGIAKARCVVAINKDEDANIFKRANLGIVCDYKRIVPALNRILKEGG